MNPQYADQIASILERAEGLDAHMDEGGDVSPANIAALIEGIRSLARFARENPGTCFEARPLKWKKFERGYWYAEDDIAGYTVQRQRLDDDYHWEVTEHPDYTLLPDVTFPTRYDACKACERDRVAILAKAVLTKHAGIVRDTVLARLQSPEIILAAEQARCGYTPDAWAKLGEGEHRILLYGQGLAMATAARLLGLSEAAS